jgi:hypothetical protein
MEIMGRVQNVVTPEKGRLNDTPGSSLKGTSGLGDIQESLFFSPTKAGPGGIIWAAGPVISFPTATEDILGTKKVSITGHFARLMMLAAL